MPLGFQILGKKTQTWRESSSGSRFVVDEGDGLREGWRESQRLNRFRSCFRSDGEPHIHDGRGGRRRYRG